MKAERRHVKKGKSFLKGTSRAKLEQMYRDEPAGKSRERLNAALLRRDEYGMEDIAAKLGHSSSTIFEWLYRLDNEGLGAICDKKSPGRPCMLSNEQKVAIDKALDEKPTKCGYVSGV